MTCNTCDYKSDCTFLAVVVSIIIGIVTAFLRFAAIITITPTVLFAILAIAVAYLAFTPVTVAIVRSFSTECCVCRILPALLTGIFGTALTSAILLAIEFAATSIIGAIITGLLLLFFTLTITSFACLARCAARCNVRSVE